MPKILIVDDKSTNREYLAGLLRYYKESALLEARDGEEALKLARRENPDLIISDILMPTMDGCELVRQLRADERLAATPVIFFTAQYHQREAQALALSCGVRRIL